MSNTLLKQISQQVSDTLIDIAWTQWHSLGAGIYASRSKITASIIDPEALILTSLLLQEKERRFSDILAWSSASFSKLLSVQRMTVLASQFPKDAGEQLGRFSTTATMLKDARWKKYAVSEPLPARNRYITKRTKPDLSKLPSLALRLRSGFGVTAKADVLAFHTPFPLIAGRPPIPHQNSGSALARGRYRKRTTLFMKFLAQEVIALSIEDERQGATRRHQQESCRQRQPDPETK